MDRPEISEAFFALEAHQSDFHDVTIADLFAKDQRRFADFHVVLDDLLFDFSKHRIDRTTLKLLLDLASAAKLEERRAALFAGAIVNATEGRPALHMALRNLSGVPMQAQGRDVMPEVLAERHKMLAFAEAVRSGAIRSATGAPFAHIVNIGIGGSDLGPAMAARALSPFLAPHLDLHFVANVDGADLADTLKRVDLARTLFIVSSKTFTTLETMTNARAARQALIAKLGEAAVAATFLRRLDRSQRRRGVRHQRQTASSASGIGSAGAIRSGRRSGFRSPSASVSRISRIFCAAAKTSTIISPRRRSRKTSRC